MKPSGNTILVTGGGSGIGRELARRWHDLGNIVIVTGRRRAMLDETANGYDNIHAVELDVADAYDIATVVPEILKRFPALNVLVNNAGIMRREDATNARDLRDAEATITTNLLGPIRMIDALISHLKKQDGSAIINITSGLAFVPLPGTPTYSATKAALHSYTVALRSRLEGQVEVIEIAPPAVRTELTPGQSTREGYMPLDDFIAETMQPFEAGDVPVEVLVQKVLFLRNAEKENRLEQALAVLSQM